MDYLVKITLKRPTILLLLIMFVKNHIFAFLNSEWIFDDLGVKMTLKMTLNH